MNPQEYRIKYLLDKYGETKIAPYECLPKESRAEINKNYYKNNIQKNRVQQLLNETHTTKQIEIEVHEIVQKTELKQLCPRCKEEQIIAVIILFIIRTYNNKCIEERTSLWKKYKLNWKLYSRIVANLLKELRKNQPVP
jgi:DNA-directed RNA polymerase subunit M/transcription elongation factor TFIIS